MNKQALALEPNKILVIAMRYLGDVLLVTPLLHSLRVAYPSAQLDVLLYDNTAAMLAGNPDVDQLITTPQRIKFNDYWVLIRRLFGNYDLAVVTQTGDRPLLYGLLASRMSIAAVPPKGQKGWWKRFLVKRWIEFDNDHTHTVLQNLKLLDLLGVAKHYNLVPPQVQKDSGAERFGFLPDTYVVLHPFPQWTYKRWTLAGWVAIGHYLNELGCTVILSGSGAQEEMDYIAQIARQLPDNTVNLAGQVSLAQLATIIAKARLYIGPDTGITHLAAATGVKVIALYGPTNPVKWAPWPSGFQQDNNPFESVGCQTVNNVSLVQGYAECVPCQLEGCERHRQSYSRCLDMLAVEKIKKTINRGMGLS